MDLRQNSPPHIIEKTQVERDLGIMIANDLKYIHQIENIQVLLFKAYFSRLFFFELNKLS